MSKRSSQPQTSPQPGPGGGVDFLVRTMIEREATGKRPIRPKNVEDLLQSSIQDESDDPDFDCGEEDSDSAGSVETDEGSNDSEHDRDGNSQDSDESDDEDYQEKDEGSSTNEDDDGGSDEESSNDESQGSDSDEPGVTKKSALRETLEKLNEADEFIGKRRPKKKRKVLKNRENSKSKKPAPPKKIIKKKSNTDSTKTKANSAQKSAKLTGKKSKAPTKVLTKKSKIGNKKVATEKKKKKKKEKKSEEKYRSILSLIDSSASNLKENRKEIEVTKPICSACLGDKSDDVNEIVECDSCGISVHEICYGISADNVSISSGSGSSSCTEPWFCDVCKSGTENMYCELCPVEGGLFKESTAGRWVHLVCAMYTQGVALHHDSSINLYEIQYSRWGSHSCSACENERQAQTGIVICCDAGLCKTYFHATCAQKLGLLSDPSQVDFAEADPYFVSCKQHMNSETIKRRIRAYNTLQEQLRVKKERKELDGLPSAVNTDHARINRKLDKVRQKTALKRAQYLNSLDNVSAQSTATDQIGASPFCNLPTSWMNGNKKQRLMHTSAKLGNDFLRKTEKLGEDIVAHELEVKHEKIIANVKRKWNVLPGMSVEYSAYYADRENRITVLIDQYEKSVEENEVLMDKDIGLKDVWETQSVNQMAMKEETDSVSQQLESLANVLTFVCPNDKKLATKLQALVRPKELAGVRRKSPSTSKGDRKSPSPRRSSTAKKSLKNRILSPSPSRAGKLTVAVCDTCYKSDSQHLITRCDKCRKHYHLSCLDPPLSRMPKRSRLCGWMCSDCCEAPSEVEGHVDTEAPRTLRGRTKIHKPRKYRGSDDSGDEKSVQDMEMSPPPKVGSKKSPKSTSNSVNSPEVKPFVDLASMITAPNTPNILSSTPMERRRRSGSANIPNPTPMSNMCSPILPQTLNGPIAVADMSSTIEGKSSYSSHSNSIFDLESTPAPAEAKPPKKKKKANVVLKPLKVKQKKVNSKEQAPTNDTAKINAISSPSKRKSSDGPLTTFKVNGIHDSPLRNSEDNKSVGSTAGPRTKKKKAAVIAAVNDQFELSLAGSSGNQGVKKAKQKKTKKKGEANSNATELSVDLVNNGMVEIKNEVEVKPLKTKKPRKKKEKEVTSAEGGTSVPNVTTEKKAKAKPVKSKTSSNSAGPIINAARVEENGVNINMVKLSSQIIVDKLKNLQNGTVKVSKKRKGSLGQVAATQQLATSSAMTTPDEKEKEKSVPPKKRKRVSSSAQPQGHHDSVDSIIKAVSTGDFSDRTLENGSCDLKPSGLPTIMQGVAPMNRQLAPEQNIMQGKAMGSGFNSGEMITVDASFLIDGAASSQSTYTVKSVPTYYPPASHKNSSTSSQDESVLKLSAETASETGNSENVIRLQYIDTPSVGIADSAVLPPSTPLASSSNLYSTATNGVCATCTKTDSKIQLVMCDKCQLEFHFMCLNPPVKYSPRRKGQPWFCSDCDDGDTQVQENGVLPPNK